MRALKNFILSRRALRLAPAARLVDEPLRSGIAGGDRAVGELDEMTLDACDTTFDPDDRGALLQFIWSCESTVPADPNPGAAIIVGDAPPPPPPRPAR